MTMPSTMRLAAALGAALVLGVTLLTLHTRDGVERPAAHGATPVARFERDATTVPQCTAQGRSGDRNRQRCFEQAFGNLVFTQGARGALTQLERLVASDQHALASCHRVAHSIGAAASTRFERNLGAALAAGSVLCASGYYHGVVERGLLGANVAEMARAGASLCSSAPAASNALVQCNHGLGHAYMLRTGYELPTAMDACLDLDARASQPCLSGVFMENDSSEFGIRARWVRTSDPLYPCTSTVVPKIAKYACYSTIAGRAARTQGGDLRAVAPWCLRIPQRGFARVCFQNLGELADESRPGDAQSVRAACSSAGAWQGHCYGGAAGMSVARSSATADAVRICSAAPAGRARERCYFSIGDRMYQTTSGELVDGPRRCARLTRDASLVASCRAGLTHIDPA